MAPRRVIVHFMHEHERDYARPRVQKAVLTEGTIVGEVDDAVLADLKSRNILVQRLDEPLVRKPRLRTLRTTKSGVGTAGFMGAAPPPRPVVSAPPNADVQYRVKLAGPLAKEWRTQIEAAGASVREGADNFELRVVMKPAAVAAVTALPFVLGVEPWSTESQAEEEDVMATAPAPGAAVEMVTYDVILLNADRRPEVLAWLATQSVTIGGFAADKIRFYAPEISTAADALRQRKDWVLEIEPYIEPTLHNDRAREILGVDPAAGGAGPGVPFRGSGQVIGVADTGIDEQHQDFVGQLANVIALGRPNDATDPNGHGTHVAGSIAGAGTASGGQLRGVAPQAQIVFQSLLDARGKLGGLPLRLQDLFEEAYGLGARVHNNSWGAATGSSYRVNCREVDDFVYNNKDMLIVISAGNEGTAADPLIGTRNSAAGFVDWSTIGSPATAKNALTVGASRSDRSNGGFSQLTYGAAWPNDFPSAPIKDAPISSDSECMSGFSSRGPCDDYRIKPDVVAPGTDILSCRSSRAPLRNYWGPFAPNAKYAFMGGTSMAAPLVAGCAALVREYYLTRRNHEPSAALVKATLINGTRRLSGDDSIADHPNLPNYHQGFGCVHLPTSLIDVVDPTQRLEFIDNWKDPTTQLDSDQRRRWQFSANGGGTIRLCLAYTDPPARAPQNNLNLLLERPGGGPKLFGNMQLPMGLNRPDAANNVEVIRIENAPAGTYTIQVTATSILRGPQDYALVVSGPLTSTLQPI